MTRPSDTETSAMLAGQVGGRTVSLVVPAYPEYFATIRAVARSASALADLSATDVEEVQMAVGEAATLLRDVADPDSALGAEFGIGDGALRVTLSVSSPSGATVDTAGMAWLMLTGLFPQADLTRQHDTTSLMFVRRASDQ